MRLLADFHIHSKNSRWFHGKNKIEEMVISANEMGLEEIAITDHGYNHLFRTDKRKIAEARKIIDEINEWSKTKVLLGIEADIIAEDGTIDVDNETLSYLDILIVGYHRMIKTDFAGFFGGQENTEEAKRKATNAFVNAINRYPVTIVAHLDSILTTDLYEIGRACSEKGVMVEINNRHCDWNEDQMNDLLASDCMFVVSSDAHRREDIGKVSKAFELIKKYNIPSENIANVEFANDELSDDEKELNVYFSIYKQKQKEREEKQKEVEEKRQTEFTESLSPEMEKALQDIAREKGISYKPKRVEDEEVVSFGIDNRLSADEEELIKQANEYLQNNSINEFDTQNMKLNDFNEIRPDEENEIENFAENDNTEKMQVNDSERQETVDDEEGDKPADIEEKIDKTNESAQSKKKSLTENKVVEIIKNSSTSEKSKQKPKQNVSFNTIEFDSLKKEENNVTQKTQKNNAKPVSKNDIAGLVKSALDEEKPISKPASENSKQKADSARKAKSKFNPLSVLDVDKISEDDKK